MRITVSHIPPGGYHFEFTEKAGSFPVLAQMMEKGEVEFLSPVTGEISALVMGDDLVEIKGRIMASLAFECGRCLERFQIELKRTFAIDFVKEPDKPADSSDGEDDYEIMETDIGTEYFTGDVIELSDTLQEQLVMNLPPHPLCSDGCKGLCPSCGTNLNSSSCSCTPKQGHPAFAALKGLKIK
jgi:uncharacterized protein